jgi:hypothetical protein
MKVWFSRPLMILIVAAPVLACGGGPTTPSVTPSPTRVAQKCRRYATELSITLSSEGQSTDYTESCAFDMAARALRCTTTGSASCTTRTELTTYPSVADFIEEFEAVGRKRASTIERRCDASTLTDVLTYDAQKRLVRLDRGPSFDMTFTAWDAVGRPTQSSAAIGSCTSAATIEYDDTARTAVWKLTPSGAGCGYNATETVAYDGVGNLVSYAYTDPDFSFLEARVVTATAEVCL